MKRFDTDQLIFTIVLATIILGIVIYNVFHAA
jgi:hypothetical protein